MGLLACEPRTLLAALVHHEELTPELLHGADGLVECPAVEQLGERNLQVLEATPDQLAAPARGLVREVAALNASRLEPTRGTVQRSARTGATRADDNDIEELARLERLDHLRAGLDLLRILATLDEGVEALDLLLERPPPKVLLLSLGRESLVGCEACAAHRQRTHATAEHRVGRGSKSDRSVCDRIQSTRTASESPRFQYTSQKRCSAKGRTESFAENHVGL